MKRMIRFTVPGKPRGKARPRVTSHGTYTPKATKEYEKEIANAFLNEISESLEGQLAVSITAVFPVPKSWTLEKRMRAHYGDVAPGKPDVDNIAKIVLDALNGVAYEDDAAVTCLNCVKRYQTQMEDCGIIVCLQEIGK